MKTTLQFVQGALTQLFPKLTDALWVSNECYHSLVPEYYQGAAYAKISCNEPLKEFTLFCKLELLTSNFTENKAYLLPSLIVRNELYDDSTMVDIEFVDLQQLKEAQSIIMKLPEDLAMTWAEDESDFAKQQYKTKNRLTFINQKVSLQTGTQKSCQASVIKVLPKVDRQDALRVTENTVITLEGLPEHQQKVINFDTIGGLNELIQQIREVIQVPIAYPHLLDQFKIQPPKGLLLFGPPGNGKTMIAKAIAYSLGAKFVSIEGPELNSKYVGVAEQRLREKFEEASQHTNSVLFIDEIDSIARNREHENSESHQIDMVATLLNLMDGIRSAKGLFVIGATNRLNSVDSALRRPGRFELEYEIGLPDQSARLDILKKNIPINNFTLLDESINDPFIAYLSEITNGYSGADLVSLYRLSVIKAIRRNLVVDSLTGRIEIDQNDEQRIRIQQTDFKETLKEITPTSLRGIQTSKQTIPWTDLIISDDVRLKMENLHLWTEKAQKSPFTERLPFMNIRLEGQESCGKKTLVQSFATHYRYELIDFDLMDYLSQSLSETTIALEDKLRRCKQVAPSILYIENLLYFPQSDPLFTKIKSALSQIGNKQPVLALLATTPNNTKEWVTSSFGSVIEIPVSNEDDLQHLAQKYDVQLSILSPWKEKPIGEVISRIEEYLIKSQ